ncbi:MAG TPA: hypothetical protein VFZ59_23265 [Verrucomicrobiae bacterium]|nr:hypothetical protein [Verrucomicrobiae bacterium]
MTIRTYGMNHRQRLSLASILCELHHQLRLQHFARCQPATHESSAFALRRWRQHQALVTILALITLPLGLPTRGADALSTWTPRTSPYGTTNNWRAIAFGNSRFVVVNQSAGLVITSTNGTDWTPCSANTNKALYGLAFGNGKFVAAGASGLITTSTDGTSWQSQASGTTAHLYHVNYDNGQFVTVGESGTILSSPNGTTWTPRNTGNTNKWNASAFGNGTNVVVGYRTQSPNSYTRSAASPNFSNWDVRDTGSTFYLSGVAFGQGKFIAVGYAGVTQTSTDGVTWSPVINATSAWLYEVAFANNTFVAVGENVIVSSTNGTTWQPRYSQSNQTIQGLAYGANTWVAVGNNGLILQADPASTTEGILLSDAKRLGTEFSFKFNGTVGQTYQVQTSTNFVEWSNLTTIACTNAPTACTLTGQNGLHRFYRLQKM